MKYLQILIILTLLTSCSQSGAIKVKPVPTNQGIEFIDYLFKDYQGKKPSASVIVIQNGKVAFVKSYGYSDLENEVLATPNTNYRIASVTKQFTALAIMLLVQQEKISYQTTLTDIFPEFPSYGKDITISHLLTHRSGLVKYNRFIEEGRTTQMLDKDVLQGLLATDSTYFPPGTKYAYSNTGYAVLAQVIERISAVSFSDFMKREIFQPLKMEHSTILESGEEIKNRAYGYIVKDTAIIAKDQSITSAIQGDGGVYTSVLDYYKWDQALYSDKLLPQTALGNAIYHYDENGKSNDRGYGFGWIVNYHNGVKILQHGGSSTGFGSHVIRIPAENLSVAIFTNRNKSGQALSHRAKALISHFSKGKFQMPFEILVEKEIDENGIKSGLKQYNKVKKDTLNHSVSKNALFNFAIGYINNNQNDVALKLLEQLISDSPAYFGGYYGKAIVLKKQGKKQKAIKYFNKTIEHCLPKEKWATNHSKKMISELEQ